MRSRRVEPVRVFAHLRVLGLEGGSGGDEHGQTGRVQDASALWERVVDLCGDYAARPRVEAAAREISLDLTESVRLLGPAAGVGREMRNRLRGELGVSVAIGIGPNVTVAQLASYTARAGEVVEVAPEAAAEFIGQVPVAMLPGVGEEWARWLGEMKVRTAQDLAALPLEVVARTLGERGKRAWEIARGGDPGNGTAMPATERAEETVSAAVELRPATEDRAQLRGALRVAADQVARQLRERGKAAQQLRVELVFEDLRHIEVRRTLPCAVWAPRELWMVARTLVERLRLNHRLVRRVRIRAVRLVLDEHGGQLMLPLPAPEARRRHRPPLGGDSRNRFRVPAVSPVRLAG